MIVNGLNGQVERLTNYKGLERKQRVNGARTLSFLLVKTERNYHSYPLVENEAVLEYDGEKYVIKNLKEKTKGKTPFKIITAKHKFFQDMINSVIDEIISGTLSLQNCMDHLIPPGYTYTIIGTFSSQVFEKFGDDTSSALFDNVLNKFGIEYDIQGTHITLANKIGIVTDSQFRYNHNVKTVEKSIDTESFSTYIKGYGKDGLVVEYTSPLAAIYEIKKQKSVRDDRYTTTEGLLDRLQSELNDKIPISLTIEQVELEKNSTKIHPYSLGDTIWFIHEILNFDDQVRILEITDYPESHQQPKLVLSNINQDATDILATFNSTKSTVEKVVDTETNTVRQSAFKIGLQTQFESGYNPTTKLEKVTFNNHENDMNALFWMGGF